VWRPPCSGDGVEVHLTPRNRTGDAEALEHTRIDLPDETHGRVTHANHGRTGGVHSRRGGGVELTGHAQDVAETVEGGHR
jgi:hypothetical protein